MTLKYFADQAVFKQKIKILSAKDFTVKGTLNYMTCNDHECLAPTDVDFEFSVKGNPAAEKAQATGNRQQATGNGQQATGNRQQAAVPTI